MQRQTLLLLSVVTLVLAACEPTPLKPDMPSDGSGAVASAASSFPTMGMGDVSKHVTLEDCYTVVDGKVYDLTGFGSKHPGGSGAIVSLCGKDGTTAFKGKHGMNLKAVKMLESTRIGTLQQ